MVGTAAARRELDHVSLVLRRGSSIARRLRAAEQITGKSRAQIARSILETFLDAWVATELSHQRMVDAMRVRMLASLAGPAAGEQGAAPGYLAYLETARRFLDASEDDAERERAGAELSRGLARDRGDEAPPRGGELRAVRARIRSRRAHSAANS